MRERDDCDRANWGDSNLEVRRGAREGEGRGGGERASERKGLEWGRVGDSEWTRGVSLRLGRGLYHIARGWKWDMAKGGSWQARKREEVGAAASGYGDMSVIPKRTSGNEGATTRA
jgi:hypothetical protein